MVTQQDKAELFKVGDKVKITEPDGCGVLPVGTVGVITEKMETHYKVTRIGGNELNMADYSYYADYELDAA